MDPFAKPTTNKKQRYTSNNPFAKALAETEHSFSDPNPKKSDNNLFSEALAKTGGKFANQDKFAQALGGNQSQPDLEKQQQEMIARQRKEALRKKLHDQVNPVDMHDVFSAKEKQVVEELEKTRQELKMLAKEIAEMRMDIDIEVTKQVVTPGTDATYYINFFQKLRNFIMLLRQKVRSARTWATQMNSKKAKKKKGKKPGLDMGGKGHEQGKAVFDSMHHERSNAYSGG